MKKNCPDWNLSDFSFCSIFFDYLLIKKFVFLWINYVTANYDTQNLFNFKYLYS